MNRSTATTIGVVAILINVILWGFAPPIIKLALQSVPAEIFLYYRFFFSMLIGAPFLLLIPSIRNSIKSWKDLRILLFIGFLTNPLCLLILFIGLELTSAFSAAVITSLVPVFVAIGGRVFLNEKLGKQAVIGIILASIGTVLVVFDAPNTGNAQAAFIGNILCLIHNLIWTTGILLMKKYAKKYHPFAFGVTGWIVGFFTVGAYSLFTSPIYVLRPLILLQDPVAMFGILYMTLFGSIIAFTAYQVAQQYLSASATSVFSYLQPVFTLPLAYILLQEIPKTLTLVGSAIIVLGVFQAEKAFSHISRRKRVKLILEKILRLRKYSF